MSVKEKKFVDLSNARYDEQRLVMEQIIRDGQCPFCEKNLSLYHKQPILRRSQSWLMTTNQWPYENTKQHLLIIYRQHAEKLSEVPDDAFTELGSLIKWAEKKYRIPGGGLAMRFGETSYSGGSVRHIHAQLIEPNVKEASYQPVRFKIGA